MSTTGPEHLSNHQRDTLVRIFEHPTSHNIEWHSVVTLLEGAGSVERRHDDTYKVRIGGHTLVLTPPKHKAIDTQQVLDLRRILTDAGYAAVVQDLQAKGKEV